MRRRKARPVAGVDDAAVVFELENIGERVEAVAPGIDRAILRKLRNGEYPRDARLDLHGCDSVRARALVHQAIGELVGEGGRCLLVIHGRGRGSAEGPVLKQSLPAWLAEPPSGPRVMAFCTATGGDGGVGATYVLLRRDR